MRFAPKSENELASANLWGPGEYDFEVNAAEEATSAKGNDMVKLTVWVFNHEGQRRTVFDYLVDTEGGAYKIRHFAEATGLLPQYERGELLADDMAGRTGRCKLTVQKDKSGQYPDKNGIGDYLKPKAGARPLSAPAQRKPVPAGDIDDDIPF